MSDDNVIEPVNRRLFNEPIEMEIKTEQVISSTTSSLVHALPDSFVRIERDGQSEKTVAVMLARVNAVASPTSRWKAVGDFFKVIQHFFEREGVVLGSAKLIGGVILGAVLVGGIALAAIGKLAIYSSAIAASASIVLSNQGLDEDRVSELRGIGVVCFVAGVVTNYIGSGIAKLASRGMDNLGVDQTNVTKIITFLQPVHEA